MRRDRTPAKGERWIIELEIAVLGVVLISAAALAGRYIWGVLFHG